MNSSFKFFERYKNYLNKKYLLRGVGILLSAFICIFNFTPFMRNIRALPSAIFVESEEDIGNVINEQLSIDRSVLTASVSGNETLENRSISIKLLKFIELRSIPLYIEERSLVKPSGNIIGISIHTKGVLVVGNGYFINSNGEKCSPSQKAGVQAGDVILSINGNPVETSEEFQRLVDSSPSRVELVIERDGKSLDLIITPEFADDGHPRIGAWVRDSTVGIGTLSFIDIKSGITAALGHAVVDADTGSIIKVRDGSIVQAKVLGVKKGQIGIPGELQGTFDNDSRRIASIMGNGELGIFGEVTDEVLNEISDGTMYIAFPNEVEEGEAYILSYVGDGGIRKFSCEIIKTVRQSSAAQKGIVIKITDEELIKSCGGIVQGMSGSPIIQNDRLVGVVTHVFVNDPTKGYGVYAYWMHENITQ